MLVDGGGVPEVWEATAALNAAATAMQPPEVQAFIKRRFLASPAAALLGMGEAVTNAADRVDELKQTGIPVLVACGENDDAWSPQQQEEMAARLGADFVTFAGAGHSPNVDIPEAVAETITTFWRHLD
jgi:pimeloyl-ACP methyl ester carboxylesterase